MQRIMIVEKASAVILKSNPPQVGIAASGTVPTTGWTHPALEPWFYIAPPADGIQDFDFVAEPPANILLPVLSPIAAHAVITRNPNDYWGKGKPLKGVRIHARENTVVATLDAAHATEARLGISDAPEGDLYPWPWLASGVHLHGDEDPFPLRRAAMFGGSGVPFPLGLDWRSLLVGKTLRVFHTGDMITMDYRPDRFNVELRPQSQQIVNVFFG